MFSLIVKHWWRVTANNTQPPIVVMKWLDVSIAPILFSENIFLRKYRIIIPVCVAAHKVWDFFPCFTLVWHVNIETCFCLKARVCPEADKVARFPPSHKYGCPLSFRLRLLWLSHSRYVFCCCFFLPQFQFLYVASCLCVAEGAQAFVY